MKDEEVSISGSYDGVGIGGAERCVLLVDKRKPDSSGKMVWDQSRTYIYEATPGGWAVTERAGTLVLGAFAVFESDHPLPLLWNAGSGGDWFADWHLRRWNPQTKNVEPAQAKDPQALKRYVGLTVVMAQIDFPAGVQGKRSAWEGGERLPHPYFVTAQIGVHASLRSLSDLLGEPLLQDISQPMADFSPEKASDAALAMALLAVNAQFRQYDRAVFSRRKGGPILGAIGGPSLNAFNNQALQNGIEIARELTRRYPQAADGWWVLAKMAEWAIHKRQGVKRVLGDPTNGLMRNPSEEGMRALEKFFELKGWAGKSQYARALPFDPDGRFATEREYWDHRYTHELYARLRDKTIDPEALGKHFGTRPNATDALALASPELSSFRP